MPRQFFLIVTYATQTWRYTATTTSILIGRGSQNDITLLDDLVSRKHARLTLNTVQNTDQWTLEDLGSANGTLLNGALVTVPTVVGTADRIQIGGAHVRLSESADADDAATRAGDATEVGPGDADPPADPLDVILPDTGVPRVTVNLAGRTWETLIPPAGLSIGRNPDNTLMLDHPRVSRRHARSAR